MENQKQNQDLVCTNMTKQLILILVLVLVLLVLTLYFIYLFMNLACNLQVKCNFPRQNQSFQDQSWSEAKQNQNFQVQTQIRKANNFVQWGPPYDLDQTRI